MPRKKESSANGETLDFEAALQQLQATIERMESEHQSLEASIADFEQGTRLAKLCQQLLDSAQLKVEKLGEQEPTAQAESARSTGND